MPNPADQTSTQSAKSGPQPKTQSSNARLAHDLGQVRRALARIERRLDKLTGNDPVQPTLETLLRDVHEVKTQVFKEAVSGAREREELRDTIAEMRAQIEDLRNVSTFGKGTRPDRPEDQQRVGIFVDVQNIFYAAKQFNARLDFEKLLKVSVGQRRLIRAIAYVVQSPEVDQSNFIAMLQQKSYEVRRKDLRQRSDGSAKGDWDMGMAIDIMGLVDKLDVVVLVSGDGDFVSLVNLVKTIGPRVEVISFEHNTARDLLNSADRHIPIEETLLMRPIENGVKPTPNRSAEG